MRDFQAMKIDHINKPFQLLRKRKVRRAITQEDDHTVGKKVPIQLAVADNGSSVNLRVELRQLRRRL